MIIRQLAFKRKVKVFFNAVFPSKVIHARTIDFYIVNSNGKIFSTNLDIKKGPSN